MEGDTNQTSQKSRKWLIFHIRKMYCTSACKVLWVTLAGALKIVKHVVNPKISVAEFAHMQTRHNQLAHTFDYQFIS